MANKIKVLVADDSALMRQVISDILNADPAIEVVGVAMDGEFALKKAIKLRPDVITMDVEMPNMNGLDALERIMAEAPARVLMLSSASRKNALVTFDALELGAVDFLAKPSSNEAKDMVDIANEIRRTVKSVAASKLRVPVKKARRRVVFDAPGNIAKKAPLAEPQQPAVMPSNLPASGYAVVAVGASTGGPEALRELITGLPANFPAGILIVQHMPEGFTRTFSERLDTLSNIEVHEAKDGDVIRPGLALVAPGNYHMVIRRRRLAAVVELNQAEKVQGHRPSCNPLFCSAAKEFGKHALGVIMTGMGRDGLDGMREIRNSGGYTFAQSEKTCVVYGMPKEAINDGCINEILDPAQIAGALTRMTMRDKNTTPHGAHGA